MLKTVHLYILFIRIYVFLQMDTTAVDMCVSSSFVVAWSLCSHVLAVAAQIGSQPRSGITAEEGEDTSRTPGEGETEGL